MPEGYSAFNNPRLGRRGGGLALIYRDTIKVRPLHLEINSTAFEHLALSLQFNSTSLNMVVLYRPPSSKIDVFLNELSEFLEILMALPGSLLIAGDFNIHVNNLSCSIAQRFRSTTESFGLIQHVNQSNHEAGHTLDLVFSRETDDLLYDCNVLDFISDHCAVHWRVKSHRPLYPRRKITFLRMKSMVHEEFLADLTKLPLFVDPADDVNAFLAQYNTGLASVLEFHAPLRQ